MKNVVVLEKPVVVCSKNVVVPEKIIIEDNRVCSYCEKILCDRMYRWKHEKICKVRILKEEKENEKKEIVEIKKQLKEQADIIEDMKKNMNKANNKITNNNINNGNIINNHIQINAIGYEDFSKILTDNQQLDVLTAGLFDESPIVNLVRKTYDDDSLKENRNTYIPNLQSNNCLTYNNEKKRFDAVNKNKHIDNIIKNRKDDIIKMYAKHGNKMKPAHKKIFNEYIENINNNESIKNKELYQKHKKEINYIIYNDKEFMKKVKDIVDKTEINIEDSEDDVEDEEEEQPVLNIVL
jgi:desulfoferrodoxin (superoxide reductase-like protein)